MEHRAIGQLKLPGHRLRPADTSLLPAAASGSRRDWHDVRGTGAHIGKRPFIANATNRGEKKVKRRNGKLAERA